ncbi:hypothetical protein BMS3Abin02_01443 [bacterium BMS3Abin02]|nr:hypothetical protein BMS3Abin02_01443 [bacterium BMS3Abin02]HDK45898.1 hypothetical protein [Actinomycetota bacterium]HDL48417.1 hypothetical protein [Actinomycetota bacterium]
MSNPDPKPGRWILPLIIIGMVGFTYFFVSSLPAPQPEGTTTTTSAHTTTSTTEAGTTSSTTTTTIPDDVQAYLDKMAEKKAELDALSKDLLAANDQWNNRADTGVTYTDTKTAFQKAIDDATVFSDSIEATTLPAGYSDLASLHADLSTAASKILGATVAALDGLQSSDTGEARATAIEEFNTAVAEFNAVYDSLAAAATAPS